jgi:hypothetical protein
MCWRTSPPSLFSLYSSLIRGRVSWGELDVDCGVDGRIVADGVGGFVRPLPIVLTVLAVVLFPAFLLWERRQERLQKTCMMPLYVWKNKSFAAVCVAVFVAWAAFNGVQYFATLTSAPISPPSIF